MSLTLAYKIFNLSSSLHSAKDSYLVSQNEYRSYQCLKGYVEPLSILLIYFNKLILTPYLSLKIKYLEYRIAKLTYKLTHETK